MRRIKGALWCSTIVALAACSPPKPPEEERRPEPQAQADAKPQSEIVQAADAYKDRARSATTAAQDAADGQRAQIDAATR